MTTKIKIQDVVLIKHNSNFDKEYTNPKDREAYDGDLGFVDHISDAHGQCFGVKFIDGGQAWYEESELELVEVSATDKTLLRRYGPDSQMTQHILKVNDVTVDQEIESLKKERDKYIDKYIEFSDLYIKQTARLSDNGAEIEKLNIQLMNLQEICNNQLESIVKLFNENSELKAQLEKNKNKKVN